MIDWYCDNAFVSSTQAVISCCPMTLRATAPSMACLSGCTACVAVNTSTSCSPPTPTYTCCDPSTIPTTLTAHIVSTAMGTFNVTLTKSGAVWQGTGTDANGNTIDLTFDPGGSGGLVSCPPNGCLLSLKCNGVSSYFWCLTVLSCSPPSYSASKQGAINNGCGGNFFSTHTVTLS